MATVEEGQLDQTEKRVAPLELFFDLVFVFAVTQVTALMAHHPTWEGLGQGMLVLIALWWAWGAYAWLTNYIAADEGYERLLMFAVMGAILIAALAVPHAFGRDALLFGIAYAIARCTSSSGPRRTRTLTSVRRSCACRAPRCRGRRC